MQPSVCLKKVEESHSVLGQVYPTLQSSVELPVTFSRRKGWEKGRVHFISPFMLFWSSYQLVEVEAAGQTREATREAEMAHIVASLTEDLLWGSAWGGILGKRGILLHLYWSAGKVLKYFDVTTKAPLSPKAKTQCSRCQHLAHPLHKVSKEQNQCLKLYSSLSVPMTAEGRGPMTPHASLPVSAEAGNGKSLPRGWI